MWNRLWGHALWRSPGISRKSMESYPNPSILSSATWPSMPKKHSNGLINQSIIEIRNIFQCHIVQTQRQTVLPSMDVEHYTDCYNFPFWYHGLDLTKNHISNLPHTSECSTPSGIQWEPGRNNTGIWTEYEIHLSSAASSYLFL